GGAATRVGRPPASSPASSSTWGTRAAHPTHASGSLGLGIPGSPRGRRIEASHPPARSSGLRGQNERMEAERMDGGAERFEAALRAAGAQHFGREVWEELFQRYGESWRHYHTLDHVADCLERLDAWKSLAQRPEEVELALWFHDAIYVPWKGSNEEKSAELARRWLEALGVPAER